MAFARILVVFPLDAAAADAGVFTPDALTRALSVIEVNGSIHVVGCIDDKTLAPDDGRERDELCAELVDDVTERLRALVAGIDTRELTRTGADITEEAATAADIAAWIACTAGEGEFDLVVVPCARYGHGIDRRHGMPLVDALLRRLAVPLLVVRTGG